MKPLATRIAIAIMLITHRFVELIRKLTSRHVMLGAKLLTSLMEQRLVFELIKAMQLAWIYFNFLACQGKITLN